ncbi:MAG: hypothetical protein R3F20_13325 [Planctomycetota bacterium]
MSGHDDVLSAPRATLATENTNLPTRLFGRRRRFIIDPRFQSRLLLAFGAQLGVFVVVLSLAVFLPPMLAMNDGDASRAELSRAARELISLESRFWPGLLAATLFAVVLAVRTSHKIAGPLYRFRRVFEAIERGEHPGPVRLRARDYLKEEARFLDALARSVDADRERLRELQAGIERLASEIADLDPAALKTRLDALARPERAR